MKIVVITGSPHKQGTSALLADKFIQGAAEAGNEVFRFNAAFENVHPCIGCDTCECGKKPCIFRDSMTELYKELIKADMIVFVSPLYYHAISAQLKMTIDRFHGIDDLLRGTKKKAMMIITSASSVPHIMNGAVASYHETLCYLGWQDKGTLLAYGCYKRTDIEKTDYPKQAYEMGKAVRENAD